MTRCLSLACTVTLLIVPLQLRAAELTIVVGELRKDTGQVFLQLLSEAAFADDGVPPAAGLALPAEPPEVTFVVPDVEPGTYAIRVMHDEDDDGKLDTGLFGIPREPWGVSNNHQRMGAPLWEDAKFDVDAEPVSLSIELRH